MYNHEETKKRKEAFLLEENIGKPFSTVYPRTTFIVPTKYSDFWPNGNFKNVVKIEKSELNRYSFYFIPNESTHGTIFKIKGTHIPSYKAYAKALTPIENPFFNIKINSINEFETSSYIFTNDKKALVEKEKTFEHLVMGKHETDLVLDIQSWSLEFKDKKKNYCHDSQFKLIEYYSFKYKKTEIMTGAGI